MNNNKKTPYDEIKGMLNVMRNLNESKFNIKPMINEDVETINTQPSVDSSKKEFDNIEVINDVEVKMISTDQEDIVLKDDEKNGISNLIDSFRQQVSELSELDPGISFNESQIRLDGSISDLDINFVYIVGDDSGLYINSDMLNIEEETMEMLDKLFKFYPIYTTTLEPLLRVRRTN